MRTARLAVLALMLVAVPARAQDAAAEATRCEEFGDDDEAVRERLADARAAIGRHEDDMRHWWSAFLTIHSVMMGASLTFAITAPDDGARIELSVQALSSFLGLATILINTPPLIGAGGRLDGMPDGTPEERLAKLVQAESLLRASAEAVSYVRGPVNSLLTSGWGLASSLTLLVGFQRFTGSTLLAIGSSVIGQGRILLHPWGIRDEWTRYQRRHADSGCALPVPTEVLAARVAPRWSFGAFGPGLSFTLAF